MANLRVRRSFLVALGLSLAVSSALVAGTLTVRPGLPSNGGSARYSGTHGLEVNVASPDRTPAFVQSSHPSAETSYRVRFYLNLRGLTMTDGDELDVFDAYDGADPAPPTIAGNPALRVVVRQVSGAFQLSAFVRLNNGSETQIPATVPLPRGWREVEVSWVRSSAAGANDGHLDLWVDGVAQTGLTGLANDTEVVNYARLGAVSGVDAGTSGTFKLDDFASQRTGYIGLLSVFADVPSTYVFWPWIQGIYAAELTSGCGSGNYCPTASVLRQEMSVFLLLAKEGFGYSPAPCVTPKFNDVPCSSPFAIWINELANRGITGGCGGGNYCPNDPVTRGQMAVFLSGMFNIPPQRQGP